MPEVLVVDDEKEIADLIEVYLRNEGLCVHTCYDASQALRIVHDIPLNLAVLDVMLPDLNGFELCKRIRERHTFPIIMLTAKVEDIDKITGLAIGADDYITKPFQPMELLARVKAQIRRYTTYNTGMYSKNQNILEFSGLVINKDTHECSLYGRTLSLTPTEFSLLWILCEHRGKVLSSEELFEKVWGEKYLESNNTVMVHIRRLREKMGETPRHPKFIKTVWGVGYKIEG